MTRWRALAAQQLRWSSALTQALVLSVVTFCVLLPLCGHRLLYSYFFLRSVYLDSMSEDVLRDSLDRGQEALRFFQSAAAAPAAAATPPRVHPPAQRPELLVTVVTARRAEAQNFHYLLQVMRRLGGLLGGCGERRCAEVLVCDVDGGPEHLDARLLEPRSGVPRQSGAGTRTGSTPSSGRSGTTCSACAARGSCCGRRTWWCWRTTRCQRTTSSP